MTRTASALDEARTLLRHRRTRIAVVGASNDPRKFGNIILNDLKMRGYDVIPINLHERTIAGLRVYRLLADVPKPIDLVNIVTPPDATLAILRDAEAAGIGLVWLQPGSFDSAVLAAASAAPFRTARDACVMVEARRIAESTTA
jgi:predicted CoA-binding protein